MKHASTAPATNKSRRTPLCRCEVLHIIKLIDCLKDPTASKKTKNAEIKLDAVGVGGGGGGEGGTLTSSRKDWVEFYGCIT